MSTPIVLGIRINADGSAAVVNMRQVEDAETRVGAAGKRAGEEASGGIKRISSAAGELRSVAQETQRTLLGLAGLHFGSEFVRDIVEANTKLQGWRFGLEAATGSQRKAGEELAFVRAESDRLGISLEASAETYTKLAAASRGTTLEGKATRDIFTAVAEASRTLHLSADQTNGALNAIQQMMSKGNVQAEELRGQLGERLPGAFNLAAQAMGVTTQQLNKMLDNGQVLATDMLPKLAAKLHELYGAGAAEAANSPAAQIERLKNVAFELKAAIGDAGFMSLLAEHAVSLTGALTKLVQSGALDVIVRGLLAIGQVSAATFVVNKVLEWTTAQISAAQASAAATAAQRAQAVASAQAAQARVAELRGTLSVIEAVRAEEVAKLAVARADVTAAERHLAAAQAAGTQSLALREVARAEEALAAARLRQSAAMTELVALGRTQGITQAQLATSTVAAEAAQARLVTSSGLLGTVWNGLKSAGSSLLALLGGWPGVIVAIVSALAYFASRSDDVDKSIARLNSRITELRTASPSLEQAFAMWASGAKEVTAAVDGVAQKQAQALQSFINSQPAWQTWLAFLQGVPSNADLAKLKLDELNNAQARLKFEEMKAGIAGVAVELHNMIFGSKAAMASVSADVLKAIDDVKKNTATLHAQNIELQTGKLAAQDWKDGQERIALASKLSGTALQQEMVALIAAQGERRKELQTNIQLSDAKKHHRDATEGLAASVARLNELLNQQTAAIGGPVDAAWSKYSKAVDDASAAARKAVRDGLSAVEAKQKEAAIVNLAAQARDKSIDAAIAESDILGNLELQYAAENEALRQNAQTREEQQALLKAETEARHQVAVGMRDQITLYPYEREGILKAVRAHRDLDAAVRESQEAQRDWQQIVQNSFDSFGNGVAQVASNALFHFKSIGQTFKDLGKSLTDAAAQTVQAIISYFLRLAVINPFLRSIFGGSWLGGALPTFRDAIAGGAVTPLAQTGASVVSAASEGAEGSGFDWTSGASWLNYGKKLWDGFKTGFSGLFGSNGLNYATARSGFLGSWSGFDPAGPGSGGTFSPSPAGSVLSILGGIYAGVNRFNSADGPLGKLSGGLAYGFGTYSLGIGASAAITSGSIAAGLSAIPVAGWIAIGAMVVDKVFGGKLFGTSYHPESSTGTLSIGAQGGSASASLKEVKQGALFSGRKWRTSDIDPGDEAREAAQNFFAEIKKAMTAAASAMSADLAPVIDASIRTVTEYDKNGRVTATKYFVDVLDKTWEEASAQLASQRVQAEAIIKQVDVSAGGAASTIAEQYRKDAERLSEAAQFLLAAQIDINKHQALLGDGATLAATLDITRSLQQADETLVQTYQRLQVETQTLRDSLALTGADIGKTGAEFVKFADDAARVAGGVDQLKTLMQQFAQAFYSTQELAQQQAANLRKQADAALTALGLDKGISQADFRKAYEAAVPTMTPDQLVQWQRAGVLLAQANDAQKAYNEALKANAVGIQQILDQLDPERANRYAGSWQEALDGINKTFDDGIEKLKELGATTDQLTQAEAGRQKAIDDAAKQAQDAYDTIVKQIRDGMRVLTQPSSELDAALSAIDDALTATIKQMEEAARRVPGMTGANPSDIDAAKQYADAQKQQIKQRYADMVRDILASLDPDKVASDSVASKLKETNQQFDDAIAKLKAYGATAAQIAQAETDRQRTLGRTATEFLQGLGIIGGGATDFSRALADIAAKESQARDAAEALAVSQGRAGASAAELARIQVWAAEQTAAAAAKLRQRRDDILSQLYGGTPGGLDEVNRRIAELESAARGLGDAAGDASASVNAAANAERDRIQFQIGDLSVLNDNQKLDIAKDAYLKGQVGRDDVAKIAQRLYASSNDYYKVYEWLLANDPKTPTQAGGGGSAGNGSSGELADLYKQRDALLAQQMAEQRKALASELVANLADEAKLRHMDALALMDVLKVDIKSIVKDIGIDIKKIDANGVLGLSNIATTLGVRLSALLGKLGIGFGDLQTGLVELTQRMGVDLERIDATNVRKLADLATMLGIGMRDLLTGLHLNLGDLSLSIEQLVSKLGIDLTNISADNVKSLAKLAGELNLGLDDIVAALHLSMSDLSDGLRELAKQQGVNLQAIDANGVKALAAMATSLNVSLSSLLDGMKLSLKDVAPGLRELTAALGIDLGNLNATNVQALGKLSGQLGTDLGTLVQTLGLSLKDIAPGLTKIANDLGINLTALTTADQAKLADLATALHIKLSDLASVLGIKLDGVSNSINANTSRIGVSIDAVAAARLAGDRDLGVRFDGLTRSVNDMRGDQVAVLRSVDSGIAQLPSVIRNSQSTADLATEMRSVRDAIDRAAAFAERQAVVSEHMLPAISRSTDDAANSSVRTASATEATAVNTRDTANSVRNGRTMPP